MDVRAWEAQVKAEEMPVDALKLANKMADDWGWDANDIGRFELAKSHTEFAEQYARKFAAEQLEEAAKGRCQWCRKDYQVELLNGIWLHSLGRVDCDAGDLRTRINGLEAEREG